VTLQPHGDLLFSLVSVAELPPSSCFFFFRNGVCCPSRSKRFVVPETFIKSATFSISFVCFQECLFLSPPPLPITLDYTPSLSFFFAFPLLPAWCFFCLPALSSGMRTSFKVRIWLAAFSFSFFSFRLWQRKSCVPAGGRLSPEANMAVPVPRSFFSVVMASVFPTNSTISPLFSFFPPSKEGVILPPYFLHPTRAWFPTPSFQPIFRCSFLLNQPLPVIVIFCLFCSLFPLPGDPWAIPYNLNAESATFDFFRILEPLITSFFFIHYLALLLFFFTLTRVI